MVHRQPGPTDVICARGKRAFNHPGNRRFRELVERHMDQYSKATTKLEKSVLVSQIVDGVRHATPPGGFLRESEDPAAAVQQKNDELPVWYEVGDAVAREKVGQGFRDLLHMKYKSSTKAKKRRRVQQMKMKRSASDGDQPNEDGDDWYDHAMMMMEGGAELLKDPHTSSGSEDNDESVTSSTLMTTDNEETTTPANLAQAWQVANVNMLQQIKKRSHTVGTCCGANGNGTTAGTSNTIRPTNDCSCLDFGDDAPLGQKQQKQFETTESQQPLQMIVDEDFFGKSLPPLSIDIPTTFNTSITTRTNTNNNNDTAPQQQLTQEPDFSQRTTSAAWPSSFGEQQPTASTASMIKQWDDIAVEPVSLEQVFSCRSNSLRSSSCDLLFRASFVANLTELLQEGDIEDDNDDTHQNNAPSMTMMMMQDED
ncbi:hypothetical protein ACA910_008460 [Epithemia clementina (nom. ined.)]